MALDSSGQRTDLKLDAAVRAPMSPLDADAARPDEIFLPVERPRPEDFGCLVIIRSPDASHRKRTEKYEVTNHYDVR
jgi:hypothetical protein